MSRTETFTQGPVGRLLYKLALPGVFGILANLSYTAVDTFFVGQLGSDALAAMSFTFPVLLLVITVAMGFATGASSVYARMLGLKMKEKAATMAADILVLSLMVSIGIMWCGWWLLEPTFLMLGANEALLPLIEDYMWVWYLNAPFFAISAMIMALMQAAGRTKVAGMLMVGTALINVILDPLLIFGLGPFPRLEIAGAAWTTVISRVILVAIQLYLVCFRYRMVSLPHWPGREMLKAWKKTLHVGVPAMGTGLVVPVAGAFTLKLVAGFGPDAVAALGVVQRMEPVVMIGFFALSGVIAPFFGQNMADELRHRQKQAFDVVVRFSLLFTLVVTTVLYFLGQYIGAAFSDSPEVIQVVALFFSITPIAYGLSGLSMCVTSGFNGMGKPMPGAIISILRIIGLYVPLVLLGKLWWGLPGVFIGTAAANILAGLLSYVWLNRELSKPVTQVA